MDRIEATNNVLKQINKYRYRTIEDYELIIDVCNYFDKIKNESISAADLKFLKYISSVVGIPHYYDLLSTFNKQTNSINDLDLNTFSSLLYESTLHRSEKTKIHKYQDQIIDKFEVGKQNRYFLSASTSFGKTFLVYEILKR